MLCHFLKLKNESSNKTNPSSRFIYWRFLMNHLTAEQQALLILLRQSLWKESLPLPAEVNWETVDILSQEQSVYPFAYDGAIAGNVAVPPPILAKWKTKLLHSVMNNERLLFAQDKLLHWFAQADIPVVVLKGSSVARYYPQPSLRILGDIDLLINISDIEKAKEVLVLHGYIHHESTHAFHLDFQGPGVHVELHHRVTELPNSAGGHIAEEETSQFMEHICSAIVHNHTFPVLSETNQALTLLLHMIRHMFSSGIGLRQLCDWALYVAYTDPDLLENTTIPVLKRCGLLQYAKVATATCMHYLDLPSQHLSWCADVDVEICRAFMTDIFFGGNLGQAAKDRFGSLFTNADAMGSKQSSLEALFSQLTKQSYMRFPITKKYKVLLPLFWLFLPLRYWARSLLGLRRKKSITEITRIAKQRRRLYDSLCLFEINE